VVEPHPGFLERQAEPGERGEGRLEILRAAVDQAGGVAGERGGHRGGLELPQAFHGNPRRGGVMAGELGLHQQHE